MTPAEALRQRLNQVVSKTFGDKRPLGKPEAISKVLRKFQKEIGGVGSAKPAQDRILAAIKTYLAGGLQALTGSGLRHLCWGLGTPPAEAGARPLIEEPARLVPLVEALERKAQAGELSFPAWRGLFVSYFAMNGEGARANRNGWMALRRLLQGSLDASFKGANGDRKLPVWFEVLRENRGLLTERPCADYVEGWLRGEREQTDKLKSQLEIPDQSWFWEWLVAATAVTAGRKGDLEFKSLIPEVIALLKGRSEYVRDRAISEVLSRFHRCDDRSIDRPLLDYVIDRRVWASPRVMSPRWGLVTPEVRRMVSGWMHERNLKDFFDLLAHDQHTDKQRLDFWLQYIDQIDDSYIVVGSDVRYTRKPAFRDLLERHKDTLCSLSDGPGANNAFIMRLGDHVVVEFGMTGNACFVYKSDQLPFELGENKWYTVRALKDRHQRGAERYLHMSGWQYELERGLKKRGIVPGGRPVTTAQTRRAQSTDSTQAAPSGREGYLSETEFWEFISEHRMGHLVEDKRDKGGWLWVRHGRDGDAIAIQLAFWGFTYKGPEKGWGR